MRSLALAVVVSSTLSASAALAADKASFTAIDIATAKWVPMDPKNPDKSLPISVVSGDMAKGPATFLLKLPAGMKAPIHSHTNDYTAVVISGAPMHGTTEADAKPMGGPGSSWIQAGKANHYDACTGPADCVLLIIYPKGAPDFIPAPTEPAKAKPAK